MTGIKKIIRYTEDFVIWRFVYLDSTVPYIQCISNLLPVLLSYHGNGLYPVSRGSSIFYLSMNLEGASACRVDSILMCLKFLDVLDLKTHGKLAVCF